MERRTVMLTGGTTYTVALPREWTESARVDPGNEVELHPCHDWRSLCIDASNGSRRTVTLGLGDVDDDDRQRRILRCYVAGFDCLRLRGIDSDSHALTRSLSRLRGLTRSENSADDITLTVDLDPGSVSLERLLIHARSSVTSLFDDVVASLTTPSAADLDPTQVDEIDRDCLAVSRLCRQLLRSPALCCEYDLSLSDCLDYYTVAEELRNAKQHATQLAALDRQHEWSDAEWLAALGSDASELVLKATDSFFMRDWRRTADLAAEVRQSTTELTKRTRHRPDSLTDDEWIGKAVAPILRYAECGREISEAATKRVPER
ncbi:hypothetical protein AUR64_16145 [Haloprofundus marisrubri]|uniref:Uncharacterized protein n=1 Tax=Haloprofundus marisrubri TaxID=1514971 RepID=A0A0W1R7R2_9EURY|nr:hypothetical protein [Haloprofundus marisrubri]KTG09311.1 hypothetical protein AUR64_16145 [Haloprofundus marisrubri]